jgi:hypothetical protein
MVIQMCWNFCVPSNNNCINQIATHLFCAAAANIESEYKGFPGPNARCEKDECQSLPSQKSAHLRESCKTIWYLHSAFDFHKQLEFTVRPELVQLVHHLCITCDFVLFDCYNVMCMTFTISRAPSGILPVTYKKLHFARQALITTHPSSRDEVRVDFWN